MDCLARLRSRLRQLQDDRRGRSREDGFTLVETLMAGVLLIIVATGIAGVLTSSIAANTVARERTGAEQCAQDQIELIRRTAYTDVGVVSGNPPGTIPASTACGNGFPATAVVAVSYRDDPTPTSYATAANYKRVTITVRRNRDSKVLTSLVTYVAPPARAPYGGINNAIVNVTVIDIGSNLPYQGATVNLANGPSSNRSDVTDSAGVVSFAALQPNPTSGSTAYYDLSVTGVPGYQTLAADLPPGAATPPATAAHVQLAPSQTSATSLRIFKPATIGVVLVDAGGSPYTGGATISVASSFTSATTTHTLASGSSSTTITSLGGAPVIPGATYTLDARTPSGLCATPQVSPVPASGYPDNVSYTFTLSLSACPSSTLSVYVQQLSTPAAGATVTVTGGPNGISLTDTTDSSGSISFTVPSGSGYTVTASKAGVSASTTASVTAGLTTNKTITLPNPPTGTLVVNVTQFSAAVSGATVTVTGGPLSLPAQTLTTGAGGQVTFTLPSGATAYAVSATKGSDTASGTASISTGATTTSNLALPNPPTGTLVVNVTQSGSPASAATVTLTGGPYSVSSSGTTNALGQVTFTGVPSGSGYTVAASKSSQSASESASVTTGSTTTVGITLPDPIATTCTLTVPSGDTYVLQSQSWSNFGTSTSLRVRSHYNDNARTYVKFDLGACSIPVGATLQAATLRLYKTTAPSAQRTYNAHRVTGSWSGTSVTWGSQPSVAFTATTSTVVSTTGSTWVDFNVLADVSAFRSGTTNNGWSIRDSSESSSTSRETWFTSYNSGTSSQRPRLTITYVP
jgi:type II secretory pathway pseudopilin PulG